MSQKLTLWDIAAFQVQGFTAGKNDFGDYTAAGRRLLGSEGIRHNFPLAVLGRQHEVLLEVLGVVGAELHSARHLEKAEMGVGMSWRHGCEWGVAVLVGMGCGFKDSFECGCRCA